ncbi:hypothetical protein [Nonomuraea sp. SYSU D8015]|uniref:hypothetical protein n=1 Tax=Nonomuraea sp. SYSU D8015 TaxID=2593644 RepID=UPI001660BBF8|nr:hypothetical protein [Nonomuraea sp. SYSU D8015]
MSLFNLAHSKGNPCQDIQNSLGTHMSADGEPCSLYRDPDSGATIHVIWRGEVEVRAIDECPALDTADAWEVSR